ncbi:MAG: PDZ domain-containing protein [Kiritimatiellae bacterium]|nr:PDZ domain-containing protein [Kiritimatiellia bacterium]
MKNLIGSILTMAFFVLPVIAEEKETKLTLQAQKEIIETLSQSVVIVEYHLQYEEGDAPVSVQTSYICPGCGNEHFENSGQQTILEKRPLETSGFLVSNNVVIATDIGVQKRFLKSIVIRKNDESTNASIISYAIDENAVFLKLEAPIEGTIPLKFDESKTEPLYALTYTPKKARWTMAFYPLGTMVSVDEFSSSVYLPEEQTVIVGSDGTPVGISMNGILPMDDSWKGSPLELETISMEQMDEMLNNLKQYVAKVMPRVLLNFRSPEADKSRGRYNYNRDNDTKTELDCLGMVISSNQVWILTSLPPKVTARLEKVTIFDENNKPIMANFKHNLKDYGIMIVETEKSFQTVVDINDGDIRKDFNKLMLRASLKVTGKERINHFWHCRIADAKFGYLNKLYPRVKGKTEDCFVFDLENRLVALPMTIKEQAGFDRWANDDDITICTDSLIALMEDTKSQIDKNNRPMSEEDAARIAWMGLELQGLSPDLARANNATEQTDNGETGGLINFVYPGSPAEKAGIQPGMILLRLFVKDNPKPLDIELDDYNYYQNENLMANYNSVPVEYLNQMPTPWQSIENTFTLLLTKIGVGQEYTADFFDNGKIISKKFIVENSPVHYKAAKKYKSEKLELTTRELTFEVLRYMKKDEDAPGVIVSKVEPGSKADVAGIKPYEIITTINEKPINNIDDLEKILKENDELIMTVERMNKPRQVRIVQSEKVPVKPTDNLGPRLTK